MRKRKKKKRKKNLEFDERRKRNERKSAEVVATTAAAASALVSLSFGVGSGNLLSVLIVCCKRNHVGHESIILKTYRLERLCDKISAILSSS